MKKLLILIALLSIILFAKSESVLRLESSNSSESIALPTIGNRLLIINHLQKKSSKGEHWTIDIYDSTFTKKNTKNIFLPRDFSLFKQQSTGDSVVWFCFAEENGKRASMILYKLNLLTNNSIQLYLKGSRQATLNTIEVVNDKVFIIGKNMADIETQIAKINLPSNVNINIAKVPPYTQILTSAHDEINNKIAILINTTKGEQTGFQCFEYNSKNDFIEKINLSQINNINITSGKITFNTTGDLIFMGTYNKDLQNSSTSEGTYIGKISNEKLAFFNTNSFADFKNISSLNIKQGLQNLRTRSNGFNTTFQILTHNKILTQNNEYVLVMESYYPEYHEETRFDSRGFMYETEVFDGNRTTNTILAAYNNDGKLVWDNYLSVKNLINYALQENTTVFQNISDSSFIISYYNNSKIYTKEVSKNIPDSKESEKVIRTINDGTSVEESNSSIAYWYQSYFILSGYQTLIGYDGKKRRTFYHDLISFE